MVISVRHPATVTRLKGGDKRVEYLTEAIDDDVLPSLLRRAHSFFRLCNGSLHHLSSLHPIDVMRAKLDLFFRFYLPTLPLSTVHSQSLIDGFQFLPVDKTTFLTIQFLISHVQCNFPQVHHMGVLSEGKLIYSSIQGDDMVCVVSAVGPAAPHRVLLVPRHQ